MGAGSAFPQLDFSTYPSQMFWLAVTFVIIYVLSTTVLLPPVAKVIEKRKSKLEDDITKARELNNEAEKLKRDYEKELNKSRKEAEAKILNMYKLIEDEEADARHQFHWELEERMNEAEDHIEKVSESILMSIEDISALLTSDIVNKVSGIKIDSANAKLAVEAVVKEVAHNDRRN